MAEINNTTANKTLITKIQLRNDTAANWTLYEEAIVLYKGEIGIEIDTRKFKIGDGTTNWKNLKYANVTDLTDYYTKTQIDNVFVKDSEFKNKVKAYINDNNIVDQSYVDSKLASVYHFKGTLSTYETESTLTLKLPDSPSAGDVYNVAIKFATNNSFVEYDIQTGPVIYEAGTNIAYTNAGNWDILGGSLDLSGYETTTSVDNKLAEKVDKEEGKGLSSLDFNKVLKTTYDDAAEKAHTHTNKAALDSVTQTTVNAAADYNTNKANILTKTTGVAATDVVIFDCGTATTNIVKN